VLSLRLDTVALFFRRTLFRPRPNAPLGRAPVAEPCNPQRLGDQGYSALARDSSILPASPVGDARTNARRNRRPYSPFRVHRTRRLVVQNDAPKTRKKKRVDGRTTTVVSGAFHGRGRLLRGRCTVFRIRNEHRCERPPAVRSTGSQSPLADVLNNNHYAVGTLSRFNAKLPERCYYYSRVLVNWSVRETVRLYM